MKRDRTRDVRPPSHAAPCRRALHRAVIILSVMVRGAVGADVTSQDFADFAAAIETSDDTKAWSLGQPIYDTLKQKYRSDVGFGAFESRLNAAEFLVGQMQQQLKRAAGIQLFAVADEVFGGNRHRSGPSRLMVAPAKRFYETSVAVFSHPIRITELWNEERAFLTAYYDLKLRLLTAAAAKAGQALAVAEPEFDATHDYTLVLPLLHASERQPINIAVLPQWMKEPEQLRRLSESCLLHYELPFQAMVIARRCAQMEQRAFLEYDFYRSAAERCGGARARIAADCLQKAIGCVPAAQPELVVELKLATVQLWLDSGNYPLAAGEAREIFETYPRSANAGRAIWLHYYALSRNNNTGEILTTIDRSLADERCKSYEPKLMYIKWWALRRQRNQGARVAALEYELLQRHGDNPMIAPILLSRATDLLASQSYDDAYDILGQLAQKFPSTRAATQARRILERLKATRENR